MAQSARPTAVIEGVVLDPTGAAIAGAHVQVSSTTSGASRQAEADTEGRFRFPGLSSGEYTLRVDHEGFTPALLKPFSISIGQVSVRRIELSPASVIEKLEVLDQAEAIDYTATTAGAALGGERIEESPAQNRNYLNFVLLAPSVASSAGSNAQRNLAGVRSVRVDSGFSFSGIRPRNNSLLIDGVDNRDETTGGNRVSIGLEMVEEFRVSGTVVGAEYGGAAGGSVNMVTRPGTNLWHGDFTYFDQNEFADARNPEVRRGLNPLFRRHQPGASVMGPVIRDKTFFSTAFEQEWERSEEWSEVPQRYNQQIGQTLASPLFARSGVRIPSPGLFPTDSSQSVFSFKADHHVDSKNSVSARAAWSRGRTTRDVQDVDNFTDVSARGTSLTDDQSFVGTWIWVPGPRFVNDLRAQFARRDMDLTPNSRGPMLDIPGVVTLGQGFRLDSNRREDHYEIVDSVNLGFRKHQLSIGGSVHVVNLDARLANRFAGIYVFPSIEDFYAGRPDIYTQSFGDPFTSLRTTPLGLWVQDRWQIAPGVTVEAGLRFDHQFFDTSLQAASNSNYSPRLGIAWRPGRNAQTVIRAGFGLFYDRYPLAFLNDAIQKDGVHGYDVFATGAAAQQAFLSYMGSGSVDPLLPHFAYHLSGSFPSTYGRKLTTGVEHSLDANTTLTAEYSWVRGMHLPRTRKLTDYYLEQSATSDYQGVSVSLHRRLTKELTYLFAYTGGITNDDASDFDEFPLNPKNLRVDWARSRQHQAHRFTASALFDVPVKGMPGWVREPLDDLSIAPMFVYGSGRPVNALETTDLYRTGAYPLSARPAGFSRNPDFSRGTANFDVRVMKTFPFHENRSRLQLGVEAFNVTNHSNPIRVSNFYSALGRPLSSYKEFVEASNARQVQFMIQFEY